MLKELINYFKLFLLLLIILAIIYGCGGTAKVIQLPLTIVNPAVNPTVLEYEGGIVTISAAIGGGRGVQSVWTTITKPDNTQDTITMNQQTSNIYYATYQAPGNPTTTEQIYTVHIYAQDLSNPPQEVGPIPPDNNLTFKVSSAGTPPPPPE